MVGNVEFKQPMTISLGRLLLPANILDFLGEIPSLNEDYFCFSSLVSGL